MMNVSPWQGEPSNLVTQPCHGAGVFKDLREKDPARRYKMSVKGNGTADASFPIPREYGIRIYYGSCNAGHFDWRDGFLCLATLRPDRFAGYEPKEIARPAVVVTRPMIVGADLRITADAQGGSITIALLDEAGRTLLASRPVTKNVTGEPVSWSDGGMLEKFTGQTARLRFEIKRAKLYSFEL